MSTSGPDPNRGPGLLALAWTTTGLAIIFVGLRMYARLFAKKAQGWDDYLICVAVACLIINSSFDSLQVQNGFGRHIQFLSQEEVVQVGKWTLAAEIQITFTLTFLKLSVCVFILRMMNRVQRYVSYTLYVLMTLLVLLGLASVLVLCLQCFPLEAFYNHSVQGTCISSEIPQRVFQTYSIIGTIIDFACVILPIAVLRGLQMDRNTKIAISSLLVLAIFPGVASIIKIVLTDYDPEDLSWDLVDVEIWNINEAGFGVMIASLPAIRPLAVRVHQTFSHYLTTQVALLRSGTSRDDTKQNTWNPQQPPAQENGGNLLIDGKQALNGPESSTTLYPMNPLDIQRRTDVSVELDTNTDIESNASKDRGLRDFV